MSECKIRVCLHGGGGPQVGEVTCLGGVTRLSISSLILIWSRLHDRWGDLPRVTSPTWGLSSPCKQAFSVTSTEKYVLTKTTLSHNDFGRYLYSPYWGLVTNLISLKIRENNLLDGCNFIYYHFHSSFTIQSLKPVIIFLHGNKM